MNRARRLAVLGLLCASACATPQEVKRATVALDEGYRANLETMQKYSDTVDALNRLHRNWARYIKTRQLLRLAVDWATMDPAGKYSQPVAMAVTQGQLGNEVVAWVNEHRLVGLHAHAPLVAGKAKLDDVVQGLPALANLVRKKVEGDIAGFTQLQGLTPFDEYARRVAVLRSANAAVRDYLAVDVTVSKDDVNEIADSIKRLRSGK